MNEALIRGADIVVVNNLVVNGLSYENFNYLIGRNSYQSNIFIFNAIFSNMKRDCWFKNALTHDIRDVLMAAYDMSYEGGEYNLSKFNSIIGVVAPQVQARAIAWLENNNITKDPITAVIAF